MKKLKKPKKMIIFTLLTLLLMGFVYEQSREFIDNKKLKAPGKLLEINGHRIHIYGIGKSKNSPTVVFTSGWRTPSPYVDYYSLQKETAKYTRSIIYERPGYGWSEIAKGERNIDTITTELHKLLNKNGEKGPYILVGHSFGSNEVLRFAQLFPKEVAGVVLLDGSNPDYTTTLKRPSKYFLKYGGLKYTLLNNTFNFLNNFGITRLLFDTSNIYSSKLTNYKNNLKLVDDSLKEIDESMIIKTLNNKNHLQEIRMDAKKLVENNNIGNIPLKVITSSLYNNSKLTRDIQLGLLNWSTNSEHIIADNSQHYIHWFRQDIVMKEIIKLINYKGEK
ncbi:MAG: alpha/beta hydrolase [Clostridium sp.]|uniref:alpha/beta fold hydrolase n=1 Tax=Clostridium TaxID=1485 RepID=UPI001F20B8D9|nr:MULTISPECIES: alpha/beta hydrolase [Clostridium]MDU7252094.1 alpha/beta hydrolase [Clostridium sp.]UJA32105.1 alpha/beta hydrolase [Clostridium sporogenes]